MGQDSGIQSTLAGTPGTLRIERSISGALEGRKLRPLLVMGVVSTPRGCLALAERVRPSRGADAGWAERVAGRLFVKRSIQGPAHGPTRDQTQFIMAPNAPMTPERFV